MNRTTEIIMDVVLLLGLVAAAYLAGALAQDYPNIATMTGRRR